MSVRTIKVDNLARVEGEGALYGKLKDGRLENVQLRIFEPPRFFEALVAGKGEFINGTRLVYPMEDQAMRFLNKCGNKFFSVLFTWLIGQRFRDTLCGTKVLRKTHYDVIADNRHYFGDFDPFGDFDLL